MKVDSILKIVVIFMIVVVAIFAFFTIPIGIFPPEVYEEFNKPTIIASPPEILIAISIIGIVSFGYLNYISNKDNQKENENED